MNPYANKKDLLLGENQYLKWDTDNFMQFWKKENPGHGSARKKYFVCVLKLYVLASQIKFRFKDGLSKSKWDQGGESKDVGTNIKEVQKRNIWLRKTMFFYPSFHIYK